TLARRLARHGLGLSGGALAVLLGGRAATAAVPLPLAGATVRAAAAFAAGPGAGAVPAPLAALTREVLRAMFLSKLKVVAALVVLAGLVAGPAGLCAGRPPGDDSPRARAAAAAKEDRAGKPGRAAEPRPTCAVAWGGKWWPAVVLATRGEKYFVHYTGW